jgi:DNA-binding NtrC family response regulator
MPENPHIMVAASDTEHRQHLTTAIQTAGYHVQQVSNGLQAIELLEQHNIDVVVADIDTPGADGLEILRKASALIPPVPVILISKESVIETAVESLKSGAFDFIAHPIMPTVLQRAVLRATERHKVLKATEQAAPEAEITSFGGLLGASSVMQDIFDEIRRCAPFKATVLITGESGTGKELVARALHAFSPYSKGPFVAVNCSALPHELVESQLFGHEKGSFTGAISTHQGVFEAAKDGTLFLDEIGDLPLEAQAKLLRTVEERQLTRLGSNTPIHVNVRLLTATNIDLKKAIQNRRFREDLYYRINVLNLVLPPLRDRRDDIPLLLRAFFDRFAKENDRPPKTLSPEALTVLTQYRWPGNVRELKNFTERLAITTKNETITIQDLPADVLTETSISQPVEDHLMAFTGLALDQVEKLLIERALAQTQNNRTRAADQLGISLRTLQRKLKEYEEKV